MPYNFHLLRGCLVYSSPLYIVLLLLDNKPVRFISEPALLLLHPKNLKFHEDTNDKKIQFVAKKNARVQL